MKKYIIGAIAAVLILIPAATYADDSTQTLLNLWKVVSGYLTPRTATNGLRIPSLASSNLCLKTDAFGNFATTTCGSGVGSTAWGDITGTLSAQTDLQGALDAKLSTTTAAATYQPIGNYLTVESDPVWTSEKSQYLTTTTAASTYYLQSNPANYITSSALTPYLTTTTAASTYYLQTNPAGYITSSALSPYLTSATAASTYPSFTYASSTYYFASNPNSYISAAGVPAAETDAAHDTCAEIGGCVQNAITLTSLSGTSPITYNNGTGAIGFNGSGYVSNAYASSTFPSFSYASSTFPSFSYASSTFTARNDWTTHDNYPAACSAGQFVTQIGDTLTCDTPPGATYTASGTLLNLTGSAFSVNAGTLTNNKSCIYVTGTGLVCNSDFLTSAITSLNGLTGASQTFATNTTATGLTQTITSSGSAHTWNLSLTSGFGIPLTASTTNWQTAYGWGNHASAGYLTSYTETDPVVKALTGIITSNGSVISAITNNSTTWDKALQWDGGATSLVAATGRTSLGLTDTATLASSTWLKVANNLSDLNNATTARTNLGLGGLAVLGVPAAGIVTSNGSVLSNITDSSANWNTAYTDRLKWDGGATGLVAATGRTSLGLGTMALEPNTGSTTITTLGTIGTGTWNGTTIAIGNGGTGQTTATLGFNALDPMTTKGDIITHNGTDSVRLAVGTNDYVLTASSTATNGIAWQASPPASLSGGIAGFVAHWDSATAISPGKLMDNGTVLGMNATSSTIGFNIQGTAGTNAVANFASSTGTSVLQITAGSQVLVDAAAQLVIPQGTAPTANDPGEIAHDTSDNQLIMDDYVVAKATQKIWSVTVASTSPAFIAAGLLKLPTELDGYTMTAIRCSVQSGTSKIIAVEDEATNSTEDITCGTSVTSDDGTIANPTATAAEEMYIDFGATSGTVDYVTISVFGQWTRE